jgi:UDP-N-acetylglucosamine 2-epimerase (non-hydrolysing)
MLIAFGTRPEYIKLKPIIEKFNDCLVLNTLQQKDLCSDIPSDFYFYNNITLSNRLDEVTTNILNNCNGIDWSKIDSVMVQGDTATAFAIALAAFHRKKKIFHIEAGLRTYDLDNPYPEELYRQVITKMADAHFCPTKQDYEVVSKESKPNSKAFITGNTVLDSISKENIIYGNDVLITLHRRENHDAIETWLSTLNVLAQENPHLKFTWIVHPNPNVAKHRNNFNFLNCINPVTRESMIDLMKRCRMVITDSGGLQEEASFLNKRTLVCRKTTERPCESSILVDSPNMLYEIFNNLKNEGEINYVCPFGDGKASDLIFKHVQSFV